MLAGTKKGDPPVVRFYRHVAGPNEKGCRLWTGAKSRETSSSKLTYGKFVPENGQRRASALAHRWIYEHTHGPLPRGQEVRHKCDTPLCVELDHLEPGTPLENAQDRDTRGRNANRNKTHCKQGHKFSEENTYMTREGWRSCRRCTADSALRGYHRRKAVS